MRRALAWLPLAFAACGAAPPRPDASLVVKCPDRAAQLYIDERYAGLAAATRAEPLPLAHGAHRLELRSEGKLAAYRDLELKPGDRAAIEVELRPDLDQADRTP